MKYKFVPDFSFDIIFWFYFFQGKLGNLDSGLLFDFRYPNCQMRLSSIKTINKTNYFLSHGAPESLTFHPKIKIIYLNKIGKYQYLFRQLLSCVSHVRYRLGTNWAKTANNLSSHLVDYCCYWCLDHTRHPTEIILGSFKH